MKYTEALRNFFEILDSDELDIVEVKFDKANDIFEVTDSQDCIHMCFGTEFRNTMVGVPAGIPDTKPDLMNVMYQSGYDEGLKAGKLEELASLSSTLKEWKSVSVAVSCDTMIKAIEARKNLIKEEDD